mgnify:CR=1 FL=1
MSFPVVLMLNKDPYNKIMKAPETITTVEGTLKDTTTIVDPEILIEYAGTFRGINYAYIEELGRYYFIKNVESYRNGLWAVQMHTDVLMSFQSSILNSPAIAARSSNNFNMMLNDDHFYTQEKPYIFTKEFPSGFDTTNASFVLALIGESVPANS